MKSNRIKPLPKELSEKIAAGEVVENPACVVKELIENAIDAEAKNITISTKGGGIAEIKVSDDGTGIHPEDFQNISKRFVTSKIYKEDDLEKISTLGFRGEALASICAISKLSIYSKQKDRSLGKLAEYKDGKIEVEQEIPMQDGTTVIVRDLFYNTPARRKFLKSKYTENKRILDIVIPYMLAYPEISFTVNIDGKVSIKTKKEDEKERIQKIINDEWAKDPLSLFFGGNNISIKGFISKPEYVNSFYTQQYFFVNRRPIVSKLLKQALSSPYESVTKRGVPGCVIFLYLPYTEVDVNVHPRKQEVRFRQNDLVFKALFSSVKKALQNMEENRWKEPLGALREKPIKYKARKKDVKEAIIFTQALISETRDIAEEKEEKTPTSYSTYAAIQIANRYIVTHDATSIVIIDQHAAAERTLYEKLLDQFKSKRIQSQILSIPIDVEISPIYQGQITRLIKNLKRIGIEAEQFGERTLRVRACPAGIRLEEISTIILELIRQGLIFSVPTQIENIAKLMACHHSIRFGEKLTQSDITKILVDLSKCNNPFSCPHGRPTTYRIPFEKLEEIFER
jgi:DNA mismatch repair protein MutL